MQISNKAREIEKFMRYSLCASATRLRNSLCACRTVNIKMNMLFKI